MKLYIKKIPWGNKNGKIIHQNWWDAAKVVPRGNFIAINAYIKNKEISQINNLILHLEKVEK